MSTSTHTSASQRPIDLRHPLRRRVLLSLCLFLALLSGLQLYGLPLFPSLPWSLAFGVLSCLRLPVPASLHRLVHRLVFALAPLMAFLLVELLNYNTVRSFTCVQILLNLIWYYMAAGVIYLLSGRLPLAAGASATLFTLIGLLNHYVIRFRGRTIFPGDLLTLRTAANVAGNYDYRLDAIQLNCLLALALFLLLLFKLPRQPARRMPRLRVVLPAAALCLCYLAVFFCTDFLSLMNINPSLWTTRGNGFFLNFSVCLRYSGVQKPDGYGTDALAVLASAEPQQTLTAAPPTNVIVIMNEALSDLAETFDLPVNEDPLPFLHSLAENTVRGTAYASVFGGTTANSEYEFLTGNTMAFLPEGTVPFHMYVTPGDGNLGLQMQQLHYRTVFMHPYLSSGWNRTSVYRSFGFDEIYFQSDYETPQLIRDYISDQSNYEQLIRLYESKSPGEKLFVFNVTMQNHSAYNLPWTGLDRSVWLTDSLQGRFSTVDQYLSLLRASDSAFQFLLDYFSQVDERTVVLMFGDHQPQVSTSFYTQVLGGTFDALPPEAAQQRQAVPFVLWANYDIPEQGGLHLSLNHLSALLTETVSLPQTAYQQFLTRLRAQLPVINAFGFLDANGVWHASRDTLPQQAADALAAYEMLQYNALFDDAENRLPQFFTLDD